MICLHAVLPGAVAVAGEVQEVSSETPVVAETLTDTVADNSLEGATHLDASAQVEQQSEVLSTLVEEQHLEPPVTAQSTEEQTVADAAENTPAEAEAQTPALSQSQQPAEQLSTADATPAQEQSAEETPLAPTEETPVQKAKKADRPSMIADRSDEGQPLTQGTTFRGGEKKTPKQFYFVTSENKYPFSVEVDSQNKATWTPQLESALKAVDKQVAKILSAEMLRIAGEEFLFVQVVDANNNKPTKVYFANPNSALKSDFKGKVNADLSILKSQWDETTIIAPSWVNTTKLNNQKRAGFRTVTVNGEKGFTVKTDDFGWFYVAKKIEKPQPTYKTFYLNPTTSFQVVVKDDTLDLAATASIPALETCDYYLDCEGKAEILTVHGEELLFTQPNIGTPVVYFSQADSTLQALFPQNPHSLNPSPVRYDATKMIKPTWVSDEDVKNIAGHTELKDNDTVIGYGLRTKKGKWFYAPVLPQITKAFYTSTNTEFKVVMKDATTVDVEATKIYLAPLKEKLSADLKALADAATDTDVVIEEINGVHILFVDLKTSTKAFADQQDSAFKDAFKDGTAGEPFYDAATIIKADWVDTSKTITHYNEIKN
ncbi:MAG: hypothetical protein Q4B28_02760 [bacterium]|nr:hypothetical protein [bacterium]